MAAGVINFNTVFFITAYNLYSAGNDIGFKALIGSLDSQNFILNKINSPEIEFKNIKQITCGDYHTLIVFRNGLCYGFGKSPEGQLGEYSSGLKEPHDYIKYKKMGTNIRWAVAYGKTTFLVTYDDEIIVHGENTFTDLYGKRVGPKYFIREYLRLDKFTETNALIESFHPRNLIFRLENGIFYKLSYDDKAASLAFNKINLPYQAYEKILYYDEHYLILDDGRLLCKTNYYQDFNDFIQDEHGYWHIKIINPDTKEEEKIKKVSKNFILSKTHNLYGFGEGYEIFNQVPFESETDDETGVLMSPTKILTNIKDFHQDDYSQWSNSIFIMTRDGRLLVGGENIEGHLGLGYYKDKFDNFCTTETVWKYREHPLRDIIKLSNMFELETEHVRKSNSKFEMVLNKSGKSSSYFEMIYSRGKNLRKSYMTFEGERVRTVTKTTDIEFDYGVKPKFVSIGPSFEGMRAKTLQTKVMSPDFHYSVLLRGSSEQKFFCTIKNRHDETHINCKPRHCIECSVTCTTGCVTICSSGCSASCVTCCTLQCTNTVSRAAGFKFI